MILESIVKTVPVFTDSSSVPKTWNPLNALQQTFQQTTSKDLSNSDIARFKNN